MRLVFELADADGLVVRQEVAADRDLTPQAVLTLPPGRRRLWSPEDPHLYSLSVTLIGPDGREADRAESYAGLRSVTVNDGAVFLNGKPRFQRLVLDQGYWPSGGLTAPDDAALENDIVLAQAAGFDGARAHQRVAEERWLYHADRLGYLVWGEFPDWGNRRDGPPVHHLGFTVEHVGQWLEVLARDYSHPCIVAWCGLNETEQPFGGQLSDLDGPTEAMYRAARAADRSRPVVDVSGYHHRVAESDIWDCHDYEQEPTVFASHYRQLPDLVPEVASPQEGDPWPAPRPGQAIFVSEFGGAVLGSAEGPVAAGYGEPLATADDLLGRFAALCHTLLSNPQVAGYAYTQLVDTYAEKNGLFDGDRAPKVPVEALALAQRGPAAIEARVAGLEGAT
jgi:beta-galactosidase/beta-glucuronidase